METDSDFQDWWQRKEVQDEIRSIQTLTGSSMAEAAIIVQLAMLSGLMETDDGSS